ncbi:MAG: hypothetical protein WCR54_05800 [Clostridia bacterium]
MQKKRILLLFIVLISLVLMISCVACKNQENATTIRVMLVDGDNYQIVSDKIVTINQGNQAKFKIEINSGYEIDYISNGTYQDGYIVADNIKYDTTIQITTKIIEVPYTEEPEELAEMEEPLYKEEFFPELIIINEQVPIETFGQECEIVTIPNNNVNIEIFPIKEIYHIGDLVAIFAKDQNFEQCGFTIDKKYYKSGIKLYLPHSIEILGNSPDTNKIIINANDSIGSNEQIYQFYKQDDEYLDLYSYCDNFENSNATFYELNTKSDGSGISHSIGARIKVENNLILYAQWKNWTDDNYFEYEVKENNIKITKVKSTFSNSEIVIPETIVNKKITEIGENFLQENPNITTIVLNKNIEKVNYNSIINLPNLETLIMFDNLTEFGTNNFTDCPKFNNLRINSYSRNVFSKISEVGYVNKHLNIQNSNKKKIITISGCSLERGLNVAEIVKDARYDDYDFISMGVNGGMGLYHMLDTIEENLNSGDIVIFSLEYRNDMYGNNVGCVAYQTWEVYESNYDILKDYDFSDENIRMLIRNIQYYLNKKNEAINNGIFYNPQLKREFFDEYGFLSYDKRPMTETGVILKDDYEGAKTDPDIISTGIDYLNNYCNNFIAKGVEFYFTFPPTWRYPDYFLQENVETRQLFMEKLELVLDIPIIGRIEDTSLADKFMCDHVNHCSNEGVDFYTEIFKQIMYAIIPE